MFCAILLCLPEESSLFLLLADLLEPLLVSCCLSSPVPADAECKSQLPVAACSSSSSRQDSSSKSSSSPSFETSALSPVSPDSFLGWCIESRFKKSLNKTTPVQSTSRSTQS